MIKGLTTHASLDADFASAIDADEVVVALGLAWEAGEVMEEFAEWIFEISS